VEIIHHQQNEKQKGRFSMRKKKLLVVVFLTMVLLLTACWSRRELNEIGLVIGLGVDKVGDEYIVSTQVVDPSEIASSKGGSGRAPVVTYKTMGKTLITAVRKLSSVTPRKLYMPHLRMFVIGETVAKEGVAPVLDVLSRDHELRTDFYVIMTKGSKAHEVLSMVTPLEKVPSTYLYTMLKHTEKYWSPFTTLKIDQLDSEISSSDKEAVVSAVAIKGSIKEGQQKKNAENISLKNYLQYTDLGVFRQDKLVGFLNETEASGYRYLINDIKDTVIEMPCNKTHKDVTELIHTKTIVTGKVVNQKPKMDVRIYAEANVAELQCQSDLLDKNVIKTLERKSQKEIKGQITSALQKMQKEYHSDIFGFGEKIHQSNPREWKKLEKNWSDVFSKMPVQVSVKVEIRNFGKVNQSTPNFK
jgi:spore germination protein KC